MFARLSHTRMLRLAGLFTWAVVGLPLLYSWLTPLFAAVPDDGMALRPTPWQGWLAYVIFGASYAWLTRSLGHRRTPLDLVVLLMMTLAAIALSYFSQSGLGSVLLMVAASVLPWMLPVGPGVAWLLVAQLAVAPVFVRWLDFPVVEAAMQSVLYAGFSGFVFVTSLVARQQAQAREDQRRLNAELRATRALLAESARVNERTRISRELHDLLGHHLTALSLNLEVAGHLVQGKARDHVAQAHTLARLLLSDVREAVSHLREGGSIDLGAALRPLAENLPSLDIHMDIAQPLTVEDPERAHVLLRCAQEAITNAVRHAHAGNLWLTARRRDGNVVLEVRDDGVGSSQLQAGNGLIGMRERLGQHGGHLQVETAPGQGLRLSMSLPMAPGPVESLIERLQEVA